MKTQKGMTWTIGRKQGSIARQFLAALGSIAILTVLLAIFSGLTFQNLGYEFTDMVADAEVLTITEAMAIAVQYNAHDTSAFMLGHLEHENEFVKHRADFMNNLNVFQTKVTADPNLAKSLGDRLNQLRSLRESYDTASTTLFSLYKEWVTLGSEIDTAWAEVDRLGDELSDLANAIVTDHRDNPALTESALRMAVAVQYNARDVNAYLLSHAEHRQEFSDHSKLFRQALTDAEKISEDSALSAQLAELKRLRTAYEARSQTLFDRFDARVVLNEQLDQHWKTADGLEGDLDGLTREIRDVAQTEADETQTRVNTTFRISLIVLSLIAALAIVLSVGLAVGLSRKIGRSLMAMVDAATRVASGELSQQVEVSSRDELGDLAVAFNQMIVYQQQMAEAAGRLAQGDLTTNITPQSDKDVLGNAFSLMIANLRNLISQVADTASTVGVASGQLATAADQASQASQQVAATIQQVAIGTTQQTQAVTDATGNTEQMARAADGIAKGAQEQAQSVQKTSTLVGEMFQIVEQVSQVARAVGQANTKVSQAAHHSVASIQQTTQGMDIIRTRSLATADKVKEMGHRSKEISRIVETIDDIADKTDMLALNAAVEAARAGEHGRGFAVVAEQVRKLSEDSKGATRDISNLIERVQDSVREAITAVENTVTEVGNGVQLAGDTAKSLQEILQATDEAAMMAEQIGGATTQLRQKSEGVVLAIESVSAVVEENTAAAEEMAAGAQEVMQAIEGVASVAEENSASAEEVSASSEEMSAQVEEVLASAQELSLLAEQLRTAIVQFRIEEEASAQPPPLGRGTSSLYATPNRPRPKTTPVLVGHGNGQLDEH